jgi:hypothetical protein
MGANEQPIVLAASLAAGSGLPAPIAIEQRSGGRNNRVFQVNLADGRKVVLKIYHKDPRDTRDRLSAEWRFLDYAWQRGVRTIPQPISYDGQAHASLIGFIDGKQMTADDIGPWAIDKAVDFIAAVNAAPRDVGAFNTASEACFSLAGHIDVVERRVAKLLALDRNAPLADQAAKFIGAALEPAWRAVRKIAHDRMDAFGFSVDDELSTFERCISPSDFGFHNALLADGQTDNSGDRRIFFIDFEYAGLDDPAKLICDFLCQPEVPVPQFCHDQFIGGVLTALGLSPIHRQRAMLLLDVYRIKWICIMLNDFAPGGERRRVHAGQAPRAQRCAVQLAKAQQSLDAMQSAG